MQLDHIFIRTSVGAPQAELLRDIGLTEGSGNRHPGQGTENRRFFFGNAFIELLWVADTDEIENEQTRPTMLFERLSSAVTSPFGICFRSSCDVEQAPFPHWEYTPGYLPPGMKIDIGLDAPLSEPMWFFLAKAAAPDSYATERQQPLSHTLGVNQISAVTLTMPGAAQLSRSATAAHDTGQVRFIEGTGHLLDIVFDDNRQGGMQDLRPHLPLIVRY
jgi:hypothetical protein